jgi:hypothetical protein
MQQKYVGWQALYMSFFSADLYRDAARNWKGLCYLYLFLLILCTQILMAVRLQLIINATVPMLMPYASKLPLFTVKNGLLTMDKESPYTIEAPNEESPQVIFDFCEKPKPQATTAKRSILVTKKFFAITSTARDSNGGVASSTVEQPNPIVESMLPDIQLGPDDATSLLETMRNVVAAVYLIFAVIAGFVFCAVQSLIYALFGKAMAAFMKVDLTYGQLIRLSVMAITPVIVIDIILRLALLNTNAGYWQSFIAPLISLAYLFFAVRSNNVPPETKEPAQPEAAA